MDMFFLKTSHIQLINCHFTSSVSLKFDEDLPNQQHTLLADWGTVKVIALPDPTQRKK